ncbi:Ldh family oxidoreductase (plasmid) [Lichenicola cladoniae]|uniref:Ldh family oxidoreductase n=1 Tax=Lichenicola cladoniae TaxID=1484109 RepID=A0A6M8HXL0_9PROT|nr:Ldh family oxidoreductase [Lichenicola cladoniae]NPD68698.1 Ldh family oxidoreductase [Acetobacteraceae bacterium]QKE93078.1 Ldh family oxidoreductase [Lichenicola cladoniae]
MSGLRTDHETLQTFTAAVLCAVGLSEPDAALCADTLVQAELWGHASHGVLRLPWYVARIASGACNPTAKPRVLQDMGALALVDADNAMGQVATTFAMDEAVRRAGTYGIAAVSVRNSNHFGTAMYYTSGAARRGMLAFLSTNASPAMAPWGGRERAVGTNPWSWAAPAGELPPLVLDIANTSVARGKVYLAHQRGELIPLTWALDGSGRPTDDPQAAIEGLIQPMAGHKGYAIALMMDVISGVLSGSAFGAGVVGPYHPEGRSGAGHFAFVLDIKRLMPLGEFTGRVRELVESLKRNPVAEGSEGILYPGELEAANDASSRNSGILLPPDTVRDLLALARAYDVTPAFLPAAGPLNPIPKGATA